MKFATIFQKGCIFFAKEEQEGAHVLVYELGVIALLGHLVLGIFNLDFKFFNICILGSLYTFCDTFVNRKKVKMDLKCNYGKK